MSHDVITLKPYRPTPELAKFNHLILVTSLIEINRKSYQHQRALNPSNSPPPSHTQLPLGLTKPSAHSRNLAQIDAYYYFCWYYLATSTTQINPDVLIFHKRHVDIFIHLESPRTQESRATIIIIYLARCLIVRS